MDKKPVRVIIGRQVQLTSPGMLGRRFDFLPGFAFLTEEWSFPGEPENKDGFERGFHDQWGFGFNTGTDLPLTFRSEDVREVVISNDPGTISIFNKAPFKVIVEE